MALLHDFTRIEKESNRAHETVACGWTRFEQNGLIYLQLDTYGRKDRKIPGKVSQSIQLDKAAARELSRIISQTFPDL
jgi:hypothetical protein